MMIINIEVPNKLLIEHFKDLLNKIGQVCVRDYYGNPKNICVSRGTQSQLHTGFNYYSPFGEYKFIEDNSKDLEQCSIVTVTVSDRSYRDNLYNYWVKGKTTVELDDFLNKTSSNS